ncbi:MAG: PhnB protein [Chloroflexia bacterium]|jgi:PhnB protein|nr:PhnB protein [Chloroflexia bacterium]
MSNNLQTNSGSPSVTVTPYLCCKGAAQAIDFYKQAFGAVEGMRLTEPDGRVSHAEIQVGGAPIYLADEFPEIDVLSPETIGGSAVLIVLQVPDVDALFNQAVAAGATVERPLSNGFDGAMRTGKVIDPFGHHWLVLTMLEDVTAGELESRYATA